MYRFLVCIDLDSLRVSEMGWVNFSPFAQMKVGPRVLSQKLDSSRAGTRGSGKVSEGNGNRKRREATWAFGVQAEAIPGWHQVPFENWSVLLTLPVAGPRTYSVWDRPGLLLLSWNVVQLAIPCCPLKYFHLDAKLWSPYLPGWYVWRKK